MPNGQMHASVSPTPEPRSYRVTVPSGEVCQNHCHLRNRTSGNSEAVTSDNNASVQMQIQTYSTEIRPPLRYKS